MYIQNVEWYNVHVIEHLNNIMQPACCISYVRDVHWAFINHHFLTNVLASCRLFLDKNILIENIHMSHKLGHWSLQLQKMQEKKKNSCVPLLLIFHESNCSGYSNAIQLFNTWLTLMLGHLKTVVVFAELFTRVMLHAVVWFAQCHLTHLTALDKWFVVCLPARIIIAVFSVVEMKPVFSSSRVTACMFLDWQVVFACIWWVQTLQRQDLLEYTPT